MGMVTSSGTNCILRMDVGEWRFKQVPAHTRLQLHTCGSQPGAASERPLLVRCSLCVSFHGNQESLLVRSTDSMLMC